jgi:competence protein ComEC
VADEGRRPGRAGTGPRTGARTWPTGGSRRPWTAAWPRPEFAVPARLREWALAEVGAGRLLPWFAVAFGTGIILYFAAEREPVWWAPSALLAASTIAAVLLRRRPFAFVMALGFCAITAGFTPATLKAALVEHPVLRYPASSVSIAGFVELREESQKTDRFVLRVERIDGSRIFDKPQRVRLSVRRGLAPPAGAFVELKAQLNPPLQPLRPGSYDFARDLYFQRIGASGFVRGAVKIVDSPTAAGVRLRAAASIQGLRDAIDFRIRSVLPGDTGSIASALITGKRDAISAHVYDALFVSGLGHVLSISGYHMAVVAGVVFFFLRALLALVPGLPDRVPIKKWAAFAALLVTAFYLVLSGAEVATQRSFIMIAIVLVGVMLDRPTLTMRTLTLAALLVLFFAPEAVVHPSFQMSFAATLALIVTYAHGVPLARVGADSSLGRRAALWGVREIVGLIIASLVAGLATMPYAAYHFHRLAPFGVLANLLAMPIVSGWVMPMGILGVIAIPFGFDAEFWRQMGYGIDWMNLVALWVAGLPGAFGRVTSFGPGPLLLGTAGLLVIGLLKTPLRWSGVVLAILAVGWALRTPVPDVLISADGRTFAVRGADGRLAFHHSGGDTFAIREWLAADADGRDVRDSGLGAGIACDPSGCIGKLADGGLVSYALAPDAFEEDCRRAVLIVTTRDPPPECAAPVIGRRVWRERGALALRRGGSGFVMQSARVEGFDRPWAPRPARRAAAATADSAVEAPNPSRPPPRDATPRPEDLQPDD